MAKIERSIIINAPVEKVFDYISDPANLMEWHPSTLDVRDITGKGESQRFIWKYKMWGLNLEGKAQVTTSTVNTKRTIKTTGGIRSTWDWSLGREAGGTRLRVLIDYTIPVPVLGKVGELLSLQRNERVADMALANIKEKMEA